MRRSALFSCLAVLLVGISACGTDSVDESILPIGDTRLGKLRGGSVDTLCQWTREQFANATGTGCALGESDAAPSFGMIVDFAGSTCGPEPKMASHCSVTVDDYEACVDALVADACGTEPTELCQGLGECAGADVGLNLEPTCSGLSSCCEQIEQPSERERCQAVATADNEVACGLELATYVGLCPKANRASE
jgi:hypothetical protein